MGAVAPSAATPGSPVREESVGIDIARVVVDGLPGPPAR